MMDSWIIAAAHECVAAMFPNHGCGEWPERMAAIIERHFIAAKSQFVQDMVKAARAAQRCETCNCIIMEAQRGR